jgi:acetyltransferase-like isoleucine patch superfamily enzyme
MATGPSNATHLAVVRLLLALPDLHRLRPYWRHLRRARIAALAAAGASVAPDALVHERVHLDRRVALELGARAELRDRVRIGIDREYAGAGGELAGSFSLGDASVVLSDAHVDCSAPVRIGRGTHVGRRNQLFTHAHDVSRRDVPVLEAPIAIRPITIGDDVMLFNDVVVLPGVTIGDGAVVAIRSVVTRDVPPYAIVAGSPARAIGERSSAL